MKPSHYFKYAFVTTALCLSTISSYAAPTEKERAKLLAQQTLDLFSGYSAEKAIKYGALIYNLSEDEALQNYEENKKAQPDAVMTDPKISFMQKLKEEFSAKDLKIIQPIFEKQFETQIEMYASCKLTGKTLQPSKTSYEFPMICQVPSVNFDALKEPVKAKNESDTAFFARGLNILYSYISSAPKKDFETSLLISVDKEFNVMQPEVDNDAHFPTSLSNQLTGTTQDELAKEDASK